MGADTYLTSLANLKQWLAISDADTSVDALLTRMNRTVSAFVLNHLNRDGLSLTQFSDVYDGYGGNFFLLRRNPVYQIQAVSFNGTAIPAATGDGFTQPYTNGWVLEPEYSIFGAQRVNLYGWVTPRMRGSVSVRYLSGYVNVETFVVPATPFKITTTLFSLGNVSVAYSNGTLLTEVSSNPSQGEYTVSNGEYTFSAADEDATVVVSYSFVPSDIENAVVELVGERYKYMDRIGILSKALGGQETVSFSQKAMSSFIAENLTPYINVTPI